MQPLEFLCFASYLLYKKYCLQFSRYRAAPRPVDWQWQVGYAIMHKQFLSTQGGIIMIRLMKGHKYPGTAGYPVAASSKINFKRLQWDSNPRSPAY